MDRAAITELSDYTEFAWERIAATIDILPPDQFGKRVVGSGWPALRDCFEHFVSAYDGWINGEWSLGLGKLRYSGPEALQSWEQVRGYRREVRAEFQAALDCSDEELQRKREYVFAGVPEMLSRADILANLLIHERGHHGDLNTLFHQLGVRSFAIDYRYFVTRPRDFVTDDG
ncbi:MAG: DinB family protein, partial [Tepidiformaceae bacterium]